MNVDFYPADSFHNNNNNNGNGNGNNRQKGKQRASYKTNSNKTRNNITVIRKQQHKNKKILCKKGKQII